MRRIRDTQKEIKLAEPLPLFLQMTEGLEVAHERGVVHSDVKPANAKITEDGNIKILDFGLGREFSEE